MEQQPVQLIMLQFAPAMGATPDAMQGAIDEALHSVGEFIATTEDSETLSHFGLTPTEKQQWASTPFASMQPGVLLVSMQQALAMMGGSTHERPLERAVIDTLKTKLMQSTLFHVELSVLMSNQVGQWHRCKACNQVKQVGEFYTRDGDNLRQPCKVCYRAGQRVRDHRQAAAQRAQHSMLVLVKIDEVA